MRSKSGSFGAYQMGEPVITKTEKNQAIEQLEDLLMAGRSKSCMPMFPSNGDDTDESPKKEASPES